MKKHDVLERIANNSPHMAWIKDNTNLLVRHGSHAYGTNVATSDEDFKGVAIPPKEYFLGSTKRFEQAELKAPDPDAVIYDIRKFFLLAAECNPNIIEVLHTDPSDHFIVDDIGEIILDNKYAFLSKKIKHTFLGYSVAQLKRIKTHRRWLINPREAEPKRKDFDLPETTLIPADQLAAASAEVQKEIDRFQFHFMESLDEPTKIEIQGVMAMMIGELKITADQQWMASARKIGLDDNFIYLMQREREYIGAKREFDQYQNWKKTRNTSRAALEAKHGYDCYLDDTEFLTEKGWKNYYDINNKLKLATLNQKSGKIEYQLPYERVCKKYNGDIIFLETQHSSCAVTPNHRMWVSDIHRNSDNKYSTVYNEANSNWHIAKAENLISGRKSWFHIRNSSICNTKEYNISDYDLKLYGAYISEGCISKRLKDGSASVIRLSQKSDGKMMQLLEEISSHFKMRKYKVPYIRNGNKSIEYVFTLANRKLAKDLDKLGLYASNKKLPEWAYLLSQRQAKILINSLILGDGSFRKYSSIYHTSSKQLADDIQKLCIHNSIVCDIWGPYEPDKMYQVYIGKEKNTEIARFNLTSNHCKIEKVSNRQIVCFSVDNEILITRRNGKVAIQGNTKHAYHLVRLIRMCEEVLTTGKVIVKRPDREELLTIRYGAWSYDQLIDFAEYKEKLLNSLYNTCNILPKVPDKEYLDKLCIKLVEKSLSKYSWYNIKKYMVL